MPGRPTHHRRSASRATTNRAAAPIPAVALIAIGSHRLRCCRRRLPRAPDPVAVLLEGRDRSFATSPGLVVGLIEARGILKRYEHGERPAVAFDQEALPGRSLIEDAPERAAHVERRDRL